MNILTCGVFDLLHTGHIDFFNKIKKDEDNLYILIHSDRFVSSYKRLPIINENQRLKMISSLKIVKDCFIDDNDYLLNDIIDKYKINKVFQGITKLNIWQYYYHIPIYLNIMNYIDYDNNNISTTKIINKIKKNNEQEDNRYSKENILKNEKLYGVGFQSPGLYYILEKIIPNNNYNNILEIGCGLGGNCNYLYNKYSCNVIGLDICKNMIEICNERNIHNNIKYILTDFMNFNMLNNFNLILCRDVFMYLQTEIKYIYLQKIKKDLKNDGICILIDYCKGNNENMNFKDFCIYKKWNIINIKFYKKLIKDANLTILDEGNISIDYINYFNKKNFSINDEIINNLKKKEDFINNNLLVWYYFILK